MTVSRKAFVTKRLPQVKTKGQLWQLYRQAEEHFSPGHISWSYVENLKRAYDRGLREERRHAHET